MDSGNIAKDSHNKENFRTRKSDELEETKNEDIDTNMSTIGDMVDNSEIDGTETQSKQDASKDIADVEAVEDVQDSTDVSNLDKNTVNNIAMDSLGSGGAGDEAESKDLDLNDGTKYSIVNGKDSQNECKDCIPFEQTNNKDNKDNKDNEDKVVIPLLKEEELKKLSFKQFNEKNWWFLLQSKQNLELINYFNHHYKTNGKNNGPLFSNLDDLKPSGWRLDWQLESILPRNMKEMDFIQCMKEELALFNAKSKENDKTVDNEVKEAYEADGNRARNGACASSLLVEALKFAWDYHADDSMFRHCDDSIPAIMLSKLLTDGFKVITMVDLTTALVDIKKRIRELYPLSPVNAILDGIPMDGMRGVDNVTNCLRNVVKIHCCEVNDAAGDPLYIKEDFLKEELPRGDEQKLVYEYRKMKYQEMMKSIKKDDIVVYNAMKCFENRFKSICDCYAVGMHCGNKVNLNDLVTIAFTEIGASANVMANPSLLAKIVEALKYVDKYNMILLDESEMKDLQFIVKLSRQQEELNKEYDELDELNGFPTWM